MWLPSAAVDRESWDQRHRRREFLTTLAANRFLVETVAAFEPGRALDLAAGQGRNAVWLAEQGWTVTAVEWSGVAVERGRRLAEHRGVYVEWIVADLREWRPPPSAFDLVLVAYLHPSEPERTALWRLAAGAVAAGGHLLVVGHDLRNLSDGVGGPSNPGHLYTADDVVAVVADEFEIIRAEEVLRPVEGAERPAIDNIVVARRPRA
jgi:SAM-dependent methyltransferase